jgi:hypothetical protein
MTKIQSNALLSWFGHQDIIVAKILLPGSVSPIMSPLLPHMRI